MLKQNKLKLTLQYEPTGCTIYFHFISIINLYMFRAGLLLIIRRYYSVHMMTDKDPANSRST